MHGYIYFDFRSEWRKVNFRHCKFLPIYVRFAKSTMPKFTPKVPLAHALHLPAMLSIVAAHPRFSLSGCVKRVDFYTKLLTRHSSGSASPSTEFIR